MVPRRCPRKRRWNTIWGPPGSLFWGVVSGSVLGSLLVPFRPPKWTPDRPLGAPETVQKRIQNRPRKGPKRAKSALKLCQKKPTTNPKSSNNQTAIDQNGAKIDPKGSQKRSQDRQKIRATSSRRSWTPLGGDFPAIHPWLGSLLEPKIEAKCEKKRDAKNRRFFYRPWKPKKSEKGAQNHSKMEPKMVQNRTQKEAQEENGKSVKTNNTTRF